MSSSPTDSVQQWQVYYVVNCRHTKPYPKSKFIVMACYDTEWWGFLINSDIRPYIRKRPRLLSCEALISVKEPEHHFLSWDSYVDCTTIYDFTLSELSDLQGILCIAAINDVRRAVQQCPVLEPYYKKLI